MTLRNRRDQAFVVMLVRIRMEKMMKLLRRREAEQSQPKAKHQDADGNPAGTANPRCISRLQVVPI